MKSKKVIYIIFGILLTTVVLSIASLSHLLASGTSIMSNFLTDYNAVINSEGNVSCVYEFYVRGTYERVDDHVSLKFKDKSYSVRNYFKTLVWSDASLKQIRGSHSYPFSISDGNTVLKIDFSQHLCQANHVSGYLLERYYNIENFDFEYFVHMIQEVYDEEHNYE